MDINRWSAVDDNNTSTVPDGAPEGWLGGEVNAWGRETMAAVRRMWEDDEWRDVSMSVAGSRYTITRDSNTQITVGAVDLSGVLFVGQRIRLTNSVAAEVLGVVVSVTYGAPDTVVVLAFDEGDDDGTSLLTTTTLEFTAGSPGSVERGGGSWIVDGFVTGDRLRVVSTLNTGYYVVSNVLALTMDLVPVQSGYAVVTEGAADFAAYRIESADLAPVAPLEGLYIPGSQSDQIRREDVTGTDPLDIPSIELLGDIAFLRNGEVDAATLGGVLEADLVPDNAVNADTLGASAATAEELEGRMRYMPSDETVGAVIAINNTEVRHATNWQAIALTGLSDLKLNVHTSMSCTGSSDINVTMRLHYGSTGDSSVDAILTTFSEVQNIDSIATKQTDHTPVMLIGVDEAYFLSFSFSIHVENTGLSRTLILEGAAIANGDLEDDEISKMAFEPISDLASS